MAPGGGDPPRNRKTVLQKSCYFRELYKMTKVLEGRIEKGKNQSFLEIFEFKVKIFQKKFQILIGTSNRSSLTFNRPPSQP